MTICDNCRGDDEVVKYRLLMGKTPKREQDCPDKALVEQTFDLCSDCMGRVTNLLSGGIKSVLQRAGQNHDLPLR